MAKSIKKVAKVATKSNGKANGTKAKLAKSRKAKVAVRAYVKKPGTGIVFDDSTRILVLPKVNPKRGASAKRFQAYLTRKPKTVAAAIAAGLTRADLRWDHGQGFIKLALK